MRTLDLALLVGIAAPVAAQAVQVVDAGGGGAFTDVQAAVDAAAPGDLVLVKSGTYGGFSTRGKPVAVVADRDATVELNGLVLVEDLAADGEAVVHGLDLPLPSRMVFDGCDGHVLVQDVVVSGGFFADVEAARITQCETVAIVSSTLDVSLADASTAVYAEDSAVRLHGCAPAAGEGLPGTTGSIPGGDGLRAVSGSVLVVGCDVRGGDGAPAAFGFPADPGHGIHLTGPGLPAVVELGNTLQGGDGPGSSGDGLPILVEAGSVESPAAAPRELVAEGVVRVGETLSLTFLGEPGDLLWLLVDVEANAATPYVPALLGALHPGPTPIVVVKLPSLDATGQRTVDVTPSPLGVPYVPTWLQALLFSPTDGFVLSNPRFVALLDGVP